MPKPITVRLQALDGVWEIPGVDRSLGVWAEDIATEGDGWGPSKASFNLRRSPIFIYPDISAFAPVEFETEAGVCWEGRVIETPSRDGDDTVINVQCEGWQYHCDDDVYERVYVHTRLADYRDSRTFLGAGLTQFTSIGKVTNDKGAI